MRPSVAPPAPAAASPAPAAVAEIRGFIVKSPMVGTFYASSAPDKPAFVSVGQQVKEGETLAIIEAMKMENEMRASHDVKIKEICVKQGDSVESGALLIKFE